jgi:1-aminocyclopropane-1-carboxylate deaminase
MEIDINTENSQEAFLFAYGGCDLWLKRDDLIHPEISGNKWRKLKYHLQDFYRGNYQQILSFGGAYSNHLTALAALGKMANIPTMALVRGEEAGDSPSLKYCTQQGMHWEAISRKDYRLKEDPEFLESLSLWTPGLYLLPEGGKGASAVKGCKEIIDELKQEYTAVAVAAGTGTTAAGLISHPQAPEIWVYAALKGGDFLKPAIGQALHEYHQRYLKTPVSRDLLKRKLRLRTEYHGGGFGKVSPELIRFMNDIYAKYSIKLDPIYTAKLLFGLLKDIDAGKFEPGSRILILHSGGLQGIVGMNQKLAAKGHELIGYEA